MHDGIMQNVENLGPLYFGLLLVKKKRTREAKKHTKITNIFIFLINYYEKVEIFRPEYVD